MKAKEKFERKLKYEKTPGYNSKAVKIKKYSEIEGPIR